MSTINLSKSSTQPKQSAAPVSTQLKNSGNKRGPYKKTLARQAMLNPIVKSPPVKAEEMNQQAGIPMQSPTPPALQKWGPDGLPINESGTSEKSVSVTKPEVKPESFFSTVISKIVDNRPAESSPEKKSKKQYVTESRVEDFAPLIVSFFTLIVTALSFPDGTAPDNSEIEKFSGYATRIVLRHLPAGKLSPDVLDLIGMISVGASWYARVQPSLGKPAAGKKAIPTIDEKNWIGKNTPVAPVAPVDPLAEISPADADFLGKVAEQSVEREANGE